MTQKTDKPDEQPRPAEVNEADVVDESATGSEPGAVPLKPRASSAAPAGPALQAQGVREAVREYVRTAFASPLPRYLGYSLLLHVALVLFFTGLGWLLPERKTPTTDQAPAQAMPAAAQPGVAEAKAAPSAEKKGGAQNPLDRARGEEQVKKILGHETAKPVELPKNPLDGKAAEDDLLKQ